jgi:hypothetical protein
MQSDDIDGIGEPLNCWQRGVTKMSIPDKIIFLANVLQNASLYLSILNPIQFVENLRGQCARRSPETEKTVDKRRLVDMS